MSTVIKTTHFAHQLSLELPEIAFWSKVNIQPSACLCIYSGPVNLESELEPPLRDCCDGVKAIMIEVVSVLKDRREDQKEYLAGQVIDRACMVQPSLEIGRWSGLVLWQL